MEEMDLESFRTSTINPYAVHTSRMAHQGIKTCELILHMMTLIGQWGDDPSQEQASVLKAHIKKVNASLDTLKPEPLHVPYEAPETRKRPPTPRRSARIPLK